MRKFRLAFSTVVFLFVSFLFITSCGDKKGDATPDDSVFWKDTIYMVMHDIYLWNDALPAAYDARKFATPELVLEDLKKYQKSYVTNLPIDHYSFLDKKGDLTGEIDEGQASGDFGFMVKYTSTTDIYVTYVYKDSPADKAGIQRGWKLTKVNGNANIQHNGTDGGPGVTLVSDALFVATNSSFTFLKPDNSQVDVPLVTASYTIKSVLYSSVINLVGGKKAGYIVFNYFLADPSVNELSPILASFESQGVNSIIIDLRYNGGGAVSTSQYLINALAPRTATNKVMFSQRYNNLMTDYYNSTEFRQSFKNYYGYDYSNTTLINKTNTLNPEKVVFIVTSGTASASELTINSLKPYYGANLKLVGGKTYGKPCGFFPWTIGPYDLYAVSFETLNSEGKADYYQGMSVDIPVSDNPAQKWGDATEQCLAQAVGFLNGTVAKKGLELPELPQARLNNQFKGMIDFKMKR